MTHETDPNHAPEEGNAPPPAGEEPHQAATRNGHQAGRIQEVQVVRQRLPSMVWLIPLVSAAIVAWLVYSTVADAGPTIIIAFKTASGVEAGKTPIKYKDVEVGLVKDVRLSPNLDEILVTADMSREMEPHLGEGTRFWVVRPRFSASGVSGVGTLVSGSYLELDPVQGPIPERFEGLEDAPLVRSDDAGKEFMLTAQRLGSLNRGSAIIYRGIQVGEVLEY
ncbi:MAG: MlaD family protein, partial [Myxococcota bacterium]